MYNSELYLLYLLYIYKVKYPQLSAQIQSWNISLNWYLEISSLTVEPDSEISDPW